MYCHTDNFRPEGSVRWVCNAKDKIIMLHKYFTIKALIFSLLSIAFPVKAEDSIRQFALYAMPTGIAQNCELVERRSSHKEKKIFFSGKRDSTGCNVSINKKKYEQAFRFCYLAGINAYKLEGETFYECFIQQRENDYLFLAQITQAKHQDSQIMCYFSCLVR